MAVERHSGSDSPADIRPARIDDRDRPAAPADQPIPGEHRVPEQRPAPGAAPVAEKGQVPAERRSRHELYADLRATDTRAEYRPLPGSHDAPRTTPDGSWEWKSLRLEAEQNYAANTEISARRKAEGRSMDGKYCQDGITPAMRAMECRLEHGHLVPDTEKFALKSEDRFKEKLARLILQEPDKPVNEHAREIHDGIRYTFLIEREHYGDGIRSAREELSSAGFELLVLKNTWDNEEYKGVNTRWLDPGSDLPFEVQFHTLESWAAKQQTHDAYEKISDLRTAPETRERLREYQKEVTRQIEVPAGWQDIDDYRREGW